MEKNIDTKLIIIDYNMPGMDGFELTRLIRQKYTFDKIAIIGLSAHGNSVLSAKFLKRGANDFIIKPFSKEEFVWRINQTIETLDYIESIKKAAITDYLTGLFNRYYFFKIGQTLFENAKRNNIKITVCMIDIDYFKDINDTYGHITGDNVLKQISAIIAGSFRSSDVVARLGGEEFCVLTINLSEDRIIEHFEELRKKIASADIETDEGVINVTVSIGVTNKLDDTLDATIHKADSLLYMAKNEGRNRVIFQ